MTYSFADVMGFGGGFSAGATLAGFELRAKREKPGGFGTPLMEANRAFLGSNWDSQACEPEKWDKPATPGGHVDVVIGTPPCAAFSGMTAGYDKHGMNSPINDCMWDLVRYAARVRPAAMIMESVSQAYTNGAVLMAQLAKELQRLSGLAYRTTHVIQDNYSLGGVTRRKRYFLVLSQVPFGVEVPDLKWLPVVSDALGDLRDMPRQWEMQAYTASPSWWSLGLRSASGLVDGHIFAPNRHSQRLMDLVDGLREAGEDPWLPGEPEERIPQRHYEKFGYLPDSWQYEMAGGRGITRDKHLIERDWKTGGFAQTRYWPWDQPGRVINGAGPHQIWHPDHRQATHREVARLMGFPDDWRCGTLSSDTKLHSYWGKGTSVAPAEWVMNWLRESLDGSPGSNQGMLLPDGSHFIDVSKHWQDVKKRLASPEVPATVTVPLPEPEPEPRPLVTRKRVVKPHHPEEAPPHRRRIRTTEKDLAGLPAGFTLRAEDAYAKRCVFEEKAYRNLVIHRGDRVLDLGAHVGVFAAWAAVHGAGHVAAVEMWPATFDVLKKNMTLVDAAVVMQAAVAEFTGTITAILGNRANPMKASVLGTKQEDKQPLRPRYSSASVPAITLPELLDMVSPDIVKFSIEGSEGFAITPHAERLAADGVRQLIGLHHIQDIRLLEQARDLHAALTAAGYRASRDVPEKPSGWPATVWYTLRKN